ncbi:hypothetical protein E3N88_01880 [Mikania micrantha]|uniref:Uncharacterized protein n=1 Tax=Mikania micrantha TaxID=192012 RepID=A0A5N6Q279_9ASTR|nr:hypothetical protein E3N88_01880 [Mikania micrantha]
MMCVTLSLLAINAASHNTHQLQASHGLTGNGYQLHHLALPRKLMFNNEIEGYEAKNLVSSIGQNTGKSYKEEVKVMVHATKGTRQEEWIKASDPTHEFFTMDYSHVRRRRPIHNKSFRKTSIGSP